MYMRLVFSLFLFSFGELLVKKINFFVLYFTCSIQLEKITRKADQHGCNIAPRLNVKTCHLYQLE